MKTYCVIAGPLQTNSYLLVHDDRAMVIDPGQGAAEALMGHAQKLGAQIEAVVLTHGHLDHTWDAGLLMHRLQVPCYLHPADEPMLSTGGVSDDIARLFGDDDRLAVNTVRPIPTEHSLELIGQSFTVAHAPGHSPGSVLLIHHDGVFCGDVVFRGSIGRTDLPDSDPRAMQQTLSEVLPQLPTDIPLLPGHGPATTLAVEKQTNPYLAGMV